MRHFLFVSGLVAWMQVAAAAQAQNPTPIGPGPEGRPVSIEEAPLLTLGTAVGDPDQEFYRLRSPFLLPDGRVVVPLAAAGEIRVFSPEGELLATHGRLGEGPGEFARLGGAWARGDTIEAYDVRLIRITRFLPDGKEETVRLEARGYASGGTGIGILGDGWAVTGITAAPYDQRDEWVVVGFLRNGALSGVLARTEGFFRYQGPGMTGPSPLSPTAYFATSQDRLYLGETLTPAIHMLDGAGNPVRDITWESERVSPAATLRRVIDLAVQRADASQRARLRERLEAAPVPEAVPLFSSLLVDDQGFVWVRPYVPERDANALGGPLSPSRTGAGGEWWIFSEDGMRVGSVEVPAGLEPYHITADAVVGIRRDELDLEYVQVHRLRRR